jgi:hypothetical protein
LKKNKTFSPSFSLYIFKNTSKLRREKMKILKTFYLVLITLVVVGGCNLSVNKSIYIKDGETVHSGPKTVNGSIYIGNNCTIKGSCNTVNGRIKVGANCKVRSLKTVNSGIKVGKDSIVDGDIGTVNGSVSCAERVKVDGEIATINGGVTCNTGVKVGGVITNINGHITLYNTIVKDDVKTYTGDITLKDKSVVEGDIVIRRSRGSRKHRTLEIRIENRSIVKGDVIVRDDDLEVTVYLSGGGKVEGKIQDAKVIKE